jgi:predicted ATP-dependent endonuclease of OLD family
MQINLVEIQNFRKLKSIRIGFAPETTLFVGANNSGKTSAMVAMRLFLLTRNQAKFSPTDFTLSNWSKINEIGERWEKATEVPDFDLSLRNEWEPILPAIDVWIGARADEIHYISHLLPTLKWSGELIGVRLRFEPVKLEALYQEYVAARSTSQTTMAEATAQRKTGSSSDFSVRLWPSNLQEFLSHRNRLHTHFNVTSYILDHKLLVEPEAGTAKPQTLPEQAESLGKNPFEGLIRIDDIDAQRGFSDLGGSSGKDGEEVRDNISTRKLSEQLRRYYTRHIDPSELPDASDIEALEGIFQAQENFNKKLDEGFSAALTELQGMGYPGLTDPKLSISTKVEPLDGLRHASAVQYDVIAAGEDQQRTARLPEQSSGLGYQNLISIIFRLISFRDHWMQVGKEKKRSESVSGEVKAHPPLHLVLVEEPEAHLHAQVQQIFIRKAYEVLRRRPELGKKKTFVTQLVVSSHSSHIVHECNFAALRYFRRIPAAGKGEAPTSVVVNLSEIFGPNDETQKFEARYIRTTHCDLFFADAVILVEGAAERMLVPHFIRENFNTENYSLYQRYISILEIGGSHAHRLEPLLTALALPTLIITDLDSGVKSSPNKPPSGVPPERNKSQVTMNDTLSTWVPKITDVDKLLDLDDKDKLISIDKFSSVRIAYQTPIMIALNPASNGKGAVQHKPVEALAYTFEDSLALENLDIFRTINGTGLVARFKESIISASSVADLVDKFYGNVKAGDKAKFALDVIFDVDPSTLKIPSYIESGLKWLEFELKRKDDKILVTEFPDTSAQSLTVVSNP